MANLPDWLKVGNSLGEIADIAEWAEPVAQAASKWVEIGRGLMALYDDVPTASPEDVITFVLDNITDQNVAAVFAGIGAADVHADLVAAQNKILASPWASLAQRVPDFREEYSAMSPRDAQERHFYNAGSNIGLATLPLSRRADGGGAFGNSNYEFELSGEAALEVEAGALWPFASAKVEDSFLRLGASGKFHAKAGVTVPFLPQLDGKLGVSAEGSGEALVEMFYRPDPNGIYLTSLVPALRSLPNPFDLFAIRDAAGAPGFAGLVVKVKGSGSLGVALTLGKDIVVPGYVDGRALAGVSIDVLRQSDWVLSLRKALGGYDVVLSRSRFSRRKWGVGAELVLDLSGITSKVNSALLKVTDFTGPLLNEFKPFLSPGTYLLTELSGKLDKVVSELIRDPALAKALVEDAKLLIGADAAQLENAETTHGLSLEEWLRLEVAGALDEVAGGVFNGASDLADKVVERIEKVVSALPENALGQRVLTAVNDATNTLKSRYQTVESKITTGNATAKLRAEFKKMGVTVRGGANAVNNAVRALRTLVDKHEAFLNQLVEATSDTAKAKLAAELSLFGKREEGSHYEVIGHIAEVNDHTAALWRSLAKGELQPFQSMLSGEAEPRSDFILNSESSIKHFASATSGFKALVTIFDIDFSFEAVATGKAEVAQFSDRVVVAASASASRNRALFGVARDANFLSVYDLVAAKLDGSLERDISLSIDLSRDDPNLESNELKGFLAALSEINLISPARIAQAEDWRQDALVKPGAKLRGKVTINFAMTGSGLRTVLAIGRLSAGGTETAKQLYHLAIQSLLDADMGNRFDVSHALALLERHARDPDPIEWMRAGNFPLASAAGPRSNQAKKKNADRIEVLKKMHSYANNLGTMFASLTEINDALPEGIDAAGLTAGQYRDLERKLAKSALKWVKLKKDWSVKLHPAMVALLKILVALERNPIALGDDHEVSQALIAAGASLPPGGGDQYLDIKLDLEGKELRLF